MDNLSRNLHEKRRMSDMCIHHRDAVLVEGPSATCKTGIDSSRYS